MQTHPHDYRFHTIGKTKPSCPPPSPRLRLRTWHDRDFPAFAAMNADPRVMKYFPALLSPGESAAFFARIRAEFDAEGFGLYAVERLADGELLGFTGLHRIAFEGPLHGEVEIGWRLRPSAWEHGYATEAARACLAHAPALGLGEIYSFTALQNLPSQRVMQRLGMEYRSEFDHPALPEGHPLRRHVLYRTVAGAETDGAAR